MLQRQVDGALNGAGATLFLVGEPGIGKTRLATEVAAWVRTQGFRVLIGRCEEQGAAPYQPFREALREYLDTAERGQVEQALPPPVACELVRILPQIARRVEIPPVSPLLPEPAHQALTEAVREFFTFVTTHDAPMLLVLDDLHWADEGSLALLRTLARQAERLRLLILGTYRDVELGSRHPLERTLAVLHRERLSQRLFLRRLPEAAVAEMVEALLAPQFEHEHEHEATGDETRSATGQAGALLPLTPARAREWSDPAVPSGLLRLLHQQTEGNPFFVEEVLQHLAEEGAIHREQGRWQVQPLQELNIPPSIKVTIGRRLERLTEASREALTLAAVIGPQFDFEVLREASGLEEECLLDLLDGWLAAHLVVEDRAAAPRASRERYRFQHALIREVLYDGLNQRRQARLHERVGRALEAVHTGSSEAHREELARHFARARTEAGVEKGIDYSLQAGEAARMLYANEAAMRHLNTALDLLDGLPEDEPRLRKRWEVVFHLAEVCWAYRAFERAQAVLEEYLARAQRAGSAWGMAAAYCELGWALRESHQAAGLRTEGARQRRIEQFEQSLWIAEEHELPDWQARSRVGIAYALCQFRYDLPRAEALLREVLHASEGLCEEDMPELYGRLMQVCALQGKWDEVAAALRQSIALPVPDRLGRSHPPEGRPPLSPLGVVFGSSTMAFCLGPMEDALDRAGKQAEFVAFCGQAKALYARAGLPLPLQQWYLEPAAISEGFRHPLYRDDFEGTELSPEWQWHDPAQVSRYSLSDKPGFLTLRAGLGTNLWPRSNLNAPRMLLAVRGDFALETRMEGNWDEHAAIGGLLVWKDGLNHLRLEKYSVLRWQHGSIQLEARIRGQLRTVGRGLLRVNAFHLRIERTGDRFAALCSADGIQWLTCGQVVLPVKDPLLVGVAAMEGMVVHFDYVQVLGKDG